MIKILSIGKMVSIDIDAMRALLALKTQRHCFLSEICMQLTDMKVKEQILQRIAESTPSMVWTPKDFLDITNRDTVDKTLQRLVTSGNLRRIDRGLCKTCC